MIRPDEHLALPLECYGTGELAILTLREALAMLCQANYGFVAPLSIITWQVDGRRGWNNVYEIAGERPASLGLYTYMHHGQPLTIDEAETLINSKKELSVGLFIAWAARFNRTFRKDPHGQTLPKESWPFRYVKSFVNGNGRILRPAYQMWDDRSSFVIAGVDRDQVDSSVVPPWSLLWREFLRRSQA